MCHLRAVLLLSPIPVSRLSRSSYLCLRVVALSFCLLAFLFVLFVGLSSLFLAVSFLLLPRLPLRLFFLFCALASRPSGMSAVEASSSFARTASLSSILAAASSPSFWFSLLAIFLLCCSPLGVVSLGSCGTGACCRFVILHVLIFTPWLSLLLQLGVSTLRGVCVLILRRFVAFSS